MCHPLALTQGGEGRNVVVAVSESARRVGVEAGMRVPQARALCESLVVRRVSVDAVASALAALVEVAHTVGPRVESDDRDRVYIDCDGIRALWVSEASFAAALTARADRCGLDAWIGIADSKLAAYLAARDGGGACIVPEGRAQEFLAPRSLSLLDADSTTSSTLMSWGIRTIGDLLELPSGAVAHRLGPNGSRLLRLARGEDEAPFVGRKPPLTFDEHYELEYPVDTLEPLLFVLRRLLECVAARMQVSGVGCRQVDLVLGFDGGGGELRKISVAAPTADPKTLLMLVRTHLESQSPARPVVTVQVTAAAARVLPTQLDFLEPAGPAPAALAATLARLAALCGPDRVGVLRPVDSHRPEAVRVEAFVGATARPGGSGISVDVPSSVVPMALRALRPAVSLEVFENGKFLDYVRGPGFGGRVVQWAGPWRVRGEWWTTDPYAREYFDVELSDGGVYRVYRDLRSGCWLADGVYD